MSEVARAVCRLDARAQERARDHLDLADLLARQRYRRCRGTVPLDELRGEARYALVHAAARYDAGRGVPFGAYGTLVIRRRLAQAVRLWRRGGGGAVVCFTDLAAGDTPDGPGFEPVCRSTARAERYEAMEWLDGMRRALPVRWAEALAMYFLEDCSLEGVGRQLGVSRERARRLVAKALARARRLAG